MRRPGRCRRLGLLRSYPLIQSVHSICNASRVGLASQNARQNSGTSASLSTRSREVLPCRSTPRQGLLVRSSWRKAHVKMREALARTWLCRAGASIFAAMANVSAGDCAGIALAPHGQHVTPDKSFGLLPRLVLFLGVLFDAPGGECRECAPGRAGGTTLRSGVFALMNLQPEPGGFSRARARGTASAGPMWNHRERPRW
jgi:hypothetical protein